MHSGSTTPPSGVTIRVPVPGDCLFTGFCALQPEVAGPSSGMLFLALGLVLSGLAGLRQRRRAGAQTRSRKPAIP